MLTPPKRAAHLVMFKISIHLCRTRSEKTQLHASTVENPTLVFNGGRPNSRLQRQKTQHPSLTAETPTTSFNGQNPTTSFNGQDPTDSFLKSSNSQDHLFRH